MGRRAVFHVTWNSHKERWEVKRPKNDRPLKTFPYGKKGKAKDFAVSKAKGNEPSQVKIHGMNGKIINEWTYGNDPEKYPD